MEWKCSPREINIKICNTRRKSHSQSSQYLWKLSGWRGNELLDFDCPLLIILQIWQFFNLFGPLLFQTNKERILQFKNPLRSLSGQCFKITMSVIFLYWTCILKHLVVWEAMQLNPLPEVDGEVGEQLVGGAAGGQDQAEEEKGR